MPRLSFIFCGIPKDLFVLSVSVCVCPQAKLKEYSSSLELPWFETALKKDDTGLDEYDAVGTFHAIAPANDGVMMQAVKELTPAQRAAARKAKRAAKLAGKEEPPAAPAPEPGASEAVPLFRVATVASEWTGSFLRLDMRQAADMKMIRKFHSLSSYAQNIGAALLGNVAPIITVKVCLQEKGFLKRSSAVIWSSRATLTDNKFDPPLFTRRSTK